MENISLIRLSEVIRRTGLSRSSIYAAISRKEFPPSIPLGARSVAWIEKEIAHWIEQRIAIKRQVA